MTKNKNNSNVLTFSNIHNGNIFCPEIENFQMNNELDFSKKKIAILYAPNGTGKTTFSKVLAGEGNTSTSFCFGNKKAETDPKPYFHVIPDQLARNIIQGETEDFLVGDNIRAEYELRENIEKGFDALFIEIASKLKNKYGVEKVTHPLITSKAFGELNDAIRSIVNTKEKGKTIQRDKFLQTISSLKFDSTGNPNDEKIDFLVQDLQRPNSIIKSLRKLKQDNIKHVPDARRYIEYSEGIKILQMFDYLDSCLVCENKINPVELLEIKQSKFVALSEKLQEDIKNIINEFSSSLSKSNDPFDVLKNLLEAIDDGNYTPIKILLSEVDVVQEVLVRIIFQVVVEQTKSSTVIADSEAYQRMTQEELHFSDEDLILIKDFVSSALSREIKPVRDQDNKIRIEFDGEALLKKERTQLNLSNGEQNFISLAFELLKAKGVAQPYIVLDDPVSSFDSVYKNKISYAIVKFLETKNVIILTHNVDLISLVEHQRNCANLYIFNNTENGNNGFIKVSDEEKRLFLYQTQFVKFLRSTVLDLTFDSKIFMVSLLPFMRSFSVLIGKTEEGKPISQLLHGYKHERIEISQFYKLLFEVEFEPYEISAQDIMQIDLPLKSGPLFPDFPLLSKALRHTLKYMQLRMFVEKKLVEKYQLNLDGNEKLANIIGKAFPSNDVNSDTKERRSFLLSRKTLLNEFNHFDVNFSIFQPAIDISDKVLEKESTEIFDFLAKL